MQHINITDTRPIDNRLVLDIEISLLTTAKTISKKISVKASEAKPLGKPLPRDKTFGIEPAIRFYDIEDGDDNEEGQEEEILVVYDSILTTSNQNLANRKLPYINTFNNEGLIVISVMRDLTVGVFENLETTSPMDMEKRLAYTQRILRGAALKKYREVMVTCRQLAKELAGDEWTLVDLTGISAEDFWNWAKTDTTGYDGTDYLAQDKCVNFKRELWFDLGKCM